MILIRFKGETLLVDSRAGYPRAKVLARDVPHPPNDHCCWKDGAWCEDAKAKAKAAACAKLNAMSRVELVAMIEGMIGEQAARVDSLQVQVAAGAGDSVTIAGDA